MFANKYCFINFFKSFKTLKSFKLKVFKLYVINVFKTVLKVTELFIYLFREHKAL